MQAYAGRYGWSSDGSDRIFTLTVATPWKHAKGIITEDNLDIHKKRRPGISPDSRLSWPLQPSASTRLPPLVWTNQTWGDTREGRYGRGEGKGTSRPTCHKVEGKRMIVALAPAKVRWRDTCSSSPCHVVQHDASNNLGPSRAMYMHRQVGQGVRERSHELFEPQTCL